MLLPEELADHPHDCGEVLTQVAGIRQDLRDTPLPDVKMTLFAGGSSYMVDGKRYVEAAVVSPEQELWTAALPQGTSAQKVELIALTKALQMAKGKTVNIYTHSRLAFATLHIHGAVYKERGPINSRRKRN